MSIDRESTERIAPSENAKWDESVLRQNHEFLGSVLSGNTDWASLSIVELSPLQQVILATSCAHSGVDYLNSRLRDLGDLNPIVARAFEPPDSPSTLIKKDEFVWMPTNRLHLQSMGPRYDDGVSVLLSGAKLGSRVTDDRRDWIGALLFHPLQNAVQHGQGEGKRPFSGIAARITTSVFPHPPSVADYLLHVSDHLSAKIFAEFVIHDNGSSIPRHFYKARPGFQDPPLEELNVYNEWSLLQTAFERHQSSKPRTFRMRSSDDYASPGVGLVGLLTAVKRLSAFMEVRTARLRAYRWYEPGEVIADSQLLRPLGVPEPAHFFEGTVFRLVVPLI